MTLLKRYWFEFETPALFPRVGVTAFSYDDALSLVKEKIFPSEALPTIKKYIENVDIQTLDQNHVIPNMGVCTIRGIWFPNLGKNG